MDDLKETHIFYHLLDTNELQWERFDEFVERCKKVGLYDFVGGITVGVNRLKDESEWTHIKHKDPLVTVVNFTERLGTEANTLEMVYNYAKEATDGTAILYLHSKGSAHPDVNGNKDVINYWRENMLIYCVDKWKECIHAMTIGADFAGGELCQRKGGHGVDGLNHFYGGNFYWMNSTTIKNLDKKSWNPDNENRYYFEACFTSTINHKEKDLVYYNVESKMHDMHLFKKNKFYKFSYK